MAIGLRREYRHSPLQDVLALGSEARMNLNGNWRWRHKANSLTKELREKLLALTLLYDR